MICSFEVACFVIHLLESQINKYISATQNRNSSNSKCLRNGTLFLNVANAPLGSGKISLNAWCGFHVFPLKKKHVCTMLHCRLYAFVSPQKQNIFHSSPNTPRKKMLVNNGFSSYFPIQQSYMSIQMMISPDPKP